MINDERRKIQLEAVEAISSNNYNGVFILPTGTGKSWVLIECLKRLYSTYKSPPTIWYLCNSTVLRDTDFPNEMRKWGVFDIEVKLMCYQTAYKLRDNKVDILIADEVDYSLTPEYVKVYLNNNFTYKILTTAFVAEDKLSYLDKIGVDIVYSKGLQEIEDSNVVNKSKYYFVNFQMTDEESNRYIDLSNRIRQLMSEKSTLYLSSDRRQLKYINYKLELAIRARKRFLNSLNSSAKICKKLLREIYLEDKSSKMLIFCELTKQADKICKYTYHSNSDSKNLEDFRDGRIQALAVCGKVNRGVNIPDIQNIIFESCNQSKTQLIQRLGRGKRLLMNEVLNVYFLIPCYKDHKTVKFTKVRDWILNASNHLDLSGAQLYKFKT